MNIKTRLDIARYLNEQGLVGVGCEVGVFQAIFSAQLLEAWQGNMLMLVDAWRPLKGYDDHLLKKRLNKVQEFNAANATLEDWNVIYEQAKANVTAFGERACFIRATSEEAASRFADETFDFVYVDADHSYEAVKHDLQLWYSKVKKGGLFCGHDFNDNRGVGVKQAVKEFAQANQLQFEVTEDTDTSPSWLIRL